MKQTSSHRLFFWGLFLMLLAYPGMAAASAPIGEILLLNPHINASRSAVDFSYGLRIKGLVSLRDQLRDGAQMVLEGTVTLLQYNLIRPNSSLLSVPLSWNLRHDPLTREFILTEPSGAIRSAPFLDELVRSSLGELHVSLRPEEMLSADETYVVQLSLILRYDKTPPWLRNAMFFWSSELSPALNFEEPFTVE